MVEAGLSGSDLAATARWLRDEHPDIAKAMGKRIREAAKPAMEAERRAVQGLTMSTIVTSRSKVLRRKTSRVIVGSGTSSGSGRKSRATAKATTSYQTALDTGKRRVSAKQMAKLQARAGLRATIARGMRVSYTDRGQEAKATVRTTKTGLPDDQKGLAKAMNTGRWRHPIFGNKKVWVTQVVSRPSWWDQTAKSEHDRAMSEVAKALDEIADTVAAQASKTAGAPAPMK